MAKRFLALDFPSDVLSFQSKEVECFFGPWTTIQENGSSLLCDVISVFHSSRKQGQEQKIIYVKKKFASHGNNFSRLRSSPQTQTGNSSIMDHDQTKIS